MAERSHPFPSRTRKLSSLAPMVLHGRLCGRVGHRQIIYQAVRGVGKTTARTAFFGIVYISACLTGNVWGIRSFLRSVSDIPCMSKEKSRASSGTFQKSTCGFIRFLNQVYSSCFVRQSTDFWSAFSPSRSQCFPTAEHRNLDITSILSIRSIY